ncbi:MAG: ABC transporter substrate-binding protein [Deltaproteobacteria bacterium]|nr:ABC transporter substrate-binding protein [Deltaproteobacteria bacterium]
MRGKSRIVLLGVAALVLGLAALGQAAPAKKLNFVLGTQTYTTQYCNFSIPMQLGYFAEEGVQVEITPAGGSLAVLTMLAGGGAEIGYGNPDALMLAAAKGTPTDVVSFSLISPKFIFELLVLEESPIKTWRDLKLLNGKSVGILAKGSVTWPIGRAMVAEAGGNPDSIDWLPVGPDVSGAEALRRGRIQALSYVDSLRARLEVHGYKLRVLKTPKTEQLISVFAAARLPWVRENRKSAVGFSRAIAKGARFCIENPEASVYLHWKQFPQSRPKGLTEKEALRLDMAILKSRSPSWEINDRVPRKWGHHTKEDWERYREFLGISPSVLPDVTRFYTNELVDEANRFDEQQIVRQARSFDLSKAK